MISKCPKCGKAVTIPSGVASEAPVRCPLCKAEFPLGESLALAPPELVPLTPRTIHVASDAELSFTTGSDADADSHGGSQSHEGGNEAVSAAPRLSATAAANQWKRRDPKSPLQVVVEVVFGGVLGCLVAYYGLAFWFGPKFNNVGLPRLPLPGIEWLTTPAPVRTDVLQPPSSEQADAK